MSMIAALGRARAPLFALAVGLVGGLAGGCAPTISATIAADQGDAKMKVNGADVGAGGPQPYTFDFGKASTFTVSAAKPGYFDTSVRVTADTPELKDNHLVKVTLKPDEAYKATVPPEAGDGPNKPVVVQVDPKLDRNAVWQRLVTDTSERYTRFTKLEKESGYLETAWDSRPFDHPDKRSMTVRTQLVVNISNADTLVCNVEVVSQVAYGTSPDQWTDYPRVYPADVALLNKIRADIGVH